MADTRRETFEVAVAPTIELRDLPSGEAVFLEGEAGRVEVEVYGEHTDEFQVEQDGERIILRAPKGRLFSRWGDYEVRVKTPPVASLSVNIASANVDVRVEARQVGVNSASGDIRVSRVTEECGIKTASGGVRIGEVDGECGVSTASGDVDISSVGGELGVKTASGDIRVRVASGEFGALSASGDLVVERYEGEELKLNTQSGDVRIGLPAGRDVDLQLDNLTGEIDVQFDGLEDSAREEPGRPMKVSARTLSGDITLFKAQG